MAIEPVLAKLNLAMLSTHTLNRVDHERRTVAFPSGADDGKELIAWLRSNRIARTAQALAARRFKLCVDAMIEQGLSDRAIAQKMGVARSIILRYRKLSLLPDIPKVLNPDVTIDWVTEDRPLFEDIEMTLSEVIDIYDDNDVHRSTDEMIGYVVEQEITHQSYRLMHGINSYLYSLGLTGNNDMHTLSSNYQLPWLLDSYLLWRQHYVFTRTSVFVELSESDKANPEYRRLMREHHAWTVVLHQIITHAKTMIDHERDQLDEVIDKLNLIVTTASAFPHPTLDGHTSNITFIREVCLRAVEGHDISDTLLVDVNVPPVVEPVAHVRESEHIADEVVMSMIVNPAEKHRLNQPVASAGEEQETIEG